MCDKTPRAVVSFSTTTDAPSQARSFAGRSLCPAHAAEADAATKLMTSELVTDAVRFGAPPIEVSLECRISELVVTVTDRGVASDESGLMGGPASTSSRLDRPQTELSRLLVDKVARDWSIEPTAEGRLLWCTVPTGTVPRAASRGAGAMARRVQRFP